MFHKRGHWNIYSLSVSTGNFFILMWHCHLDVIRASFPVTHRRKPSTAILSWSKVRKIVTLYPSRMVKVKRQTDTRHSIIIWRRWSIMATIQLALKGKSTSFGRIMEKDKIISVILFSINSVKYSIKSADHVRVKNNTKTVVIYFNWGVRNNLVPGGGGCRGFNNVWVVGTRKRAESCAKLNIYSKPVPGIEYSVLITNQCKV